MNRTAELVITMIKVDLTKQLEKKFGQNPKDWPSIKEMASSMDMHRLSVSAWLKGRIETVDLGALAKWCEYLECNPGDVFVKD